MRIELLTPQSHQAPFLEVCADHYRIWLVHKPNTKQGTYLELDFLGNVNRVTQDSSGTILSTVLLTHRRYNVASGKFKKYDAITKSSAGSLIINIARDIRKRNEQTRQDPAMFLVADVFETAANELREEFVATLKEEKRHAPDREKSRHEGDLSS